PVRSAISEAVRLGNDFGTKNSARFINGVMCKIKDFFDKENSENDENNENENKE
ncbi:MAG: transcription antitermination factor NusB, partial [Synergistaceae bacterium]|nr:transcription antitermination factor NusB [Synergistaceae bacterium]